MNTAEMRVVQNTLYVDLAGLKENTTFSYYYEFVNGFNSMRSATKTFKTETGNGGGDEPPTPPEVMLPTVITASVTEITANSAKGGGEVTNDGGAEVTERGICWSTSANPTLSDSHVAAGTGIGAFIAMMNGLEASTTYHVRAYATNEAGTAYGLDREFTTLSGGGSGAPEGAIDGLFSVSPTKKVFFSQGNLQYQASTNTWRFAEHQWDHVGGTDYITGVFDGNVEGSTNNDISSDYSGWIDLFKFGTSGYDHGAVCYQPWSTNSENVNYYAYGHWNYNLYDMNGQADWGYNPIFNGGNQEHQWRTLAIEEWEYVLFTRNTISNARFSKAKVNGVNGMILLPDEWLITIFPLNDTNETGAGFGSNDISLSQWDDLFESNGAVFLPVTGYRTNGSTVCWPWSDADYSSSSYYNVERVRYMCFGETGVHAGDGEWQTPRYVANAVRLVQDANH